MRLEDALRFNGYTIEQIDVAASTITVPEGSIELPDMRLSKLSWQRGVLPAPTPADSFYLEALPLFDNAYRPVILSHILDRFSTRRVSYNTLDQFGIAVRRWANLNLGPMSVLNRRYTSTAVALPLTTQDSTTDRATTDLARDATSDFPQGQLAGNVDYASFATDRSAATTDDTTYAGRQGVSVMALLAEQRAAYLNVDLEVLEAMEPLFLGVWDRDERDAEIGSPMSVLGFIPGH